MYTIIEVARRFNLSRSTLLYYDKIGLLRATQRTESNYRLYSEADAHRLKQICFYRQTGLPLSKIQRILNSEGNDITDILEQRLMELEGEIQAMKNQQKVLLSLLQHDRSSIQVENRIQGMDRKKWTTLLRSVGMTDADMRNWHLEFERMTPEGHNDFLVALGIPPDEIQLIRQWAQGKMNPN